MMHLRAAALAFWAAAGIAAAELTPGQWRADLAFLAKELPERHKNLYHTLPKAEFDRRLQELSLAVPRLTGLEVRAGITRLAASIADGHTGAELQSDRTIDLRFADFPEGLFVIGAAKEYARAVGARVAAIGGVPIAEVRRRLSEFVQLENEFAAQEYAAWVGNVSALQAAGIANSEETVDFRLENQGRKIALSVRTRSRKSPRPAWTAASTPQPLWQQHADIAYWWQYLAEARTLYIQYNSCVEMPTLPFRKFTEEIVRQAAREAPRKVVIDVRHNGGGNSEMVKPLMEAMRAHAELRPPGGVYVLAGIGTFSSGLLNAMEISEQFRAFVAGQPPAERPNHYGNLQTLRLPNSGMVISYATKYFHSLEDDPPAWMPELNQPLTAADFFAGRDAVLDGVLNLPASIEKNFEDAIQRDAAGSRAYAPLARLYDDSGRARAAEALLKKGTEANPAAELPALALAAHYERLKQYQKAREALAGFHTAPAICARGSVNLEEGKYAAAEDAFRQCFRLEPENLRGLQGLGDAYARQNKRADAIGVLREEADRVPGDVDVRIWVGRFANSIGKPDGAALEYEKALALPAGRRRFELWIELSEIYRHEADSAAAMRAFDSACQAIAELLETMPADPRMVTGYIRNYYEQALQREPNDPVLRRNLARIASMETGK